MVHTVTTWYLKKVTCADGDMLTLDIAYKVRTVYYEHYNNELYYVSKNKYST